MKEKQVALVTGGRSGQDGSSLAHRPGRRSVPLLWGKIRLTVSKLAQLDARAFKQCFSLFMHAVLVKWYFHLNAVLHRMRPVRGVTLIGHFGARDSLGKVARDFAIRLRDAGIPFQTFSLDANALDDFAPVQTPREEFRTLKFDHVIDVYGNTFPDIRGIKKGSLLFWEFESGFAEAHPLHDMNGNAIAMSDFDYDYFQKIFAAPAIVSKIRYPFRLEVGELPKREEIRRRFGIPGDAVVVFFNFDFGSSVGRKNPDGLMLAFAKVAAADKHAVLVYKTMRGSPATIGMLMKRASELGISSQFIHIGEYLSIQDLYGLTAASDVYASLHRGEGFGLGIAEAMSLGVPVVITAYGGPMEFCNAENSALVPYRLIEPDKKELDHLCYKDIKAWAEPDLDVTADLLRRMLTDVAYRRRLGEAAKRHISDYFSMAQFKKSMDAYLDA